MVLVDTSSWIRFLRPDGNPTVRALVARDDDRTQGPHAVRPLFERTEQLNAPASA